MELYEQLVEKDEEALKKLMNQYGNTLLRTAYLLVKDTHTAEEAVQDTFVIAFEKIDQLREPEQLKSWLTSIVINQCRNRMRRWSWKNILLSFKDKEDEWQEANDLSPEEIVIDMDQRQSLLQAIQELDYKYREVITLFYFNEWAVDEIALHLKQNKNTIKTRLARARQQLKVILAKEEIYNEAETVWTKSYTKAARK